eukprot:scaffold181350_cov28-Tisochrysis_lutea.AAC.2
MGNLESAEGLDGAVSYCSVRLDRHGAVMSIVYLGAIPADEGVSPGCSGAVWARSCALRPFTWAPAC